MSVLEIVEGSREVQAEGGNVGALKLETGWGVLNSTFIV